MKQATERIRACFENCISIPSPVVYDVTDSTNLHAKVLAEQGAAHGTAVIALSQTAGRGRFTRRFESDAGGLYMSVILRDIPIEGATRLTPFAAICAARAIESLCSGITLDVKWVNDLYLRGRKLAGILTESSLATNGKTLSYAIVGIGINLTNKLSGELADIAVSLGEITKAPEIGVLAQEITRRLMQANDALASGAFMQEYRERCTLLGTRVTVFADEVYEATALSIGDDAALTVLLDNGEKKTLTSGEVSVRLK